MSKKKNKLINFYDYVPKQTKYYNPNGPHVPTHPANIIVVGRTGTGKTNAILNYINQSQNFDKIILFAKLAHTEPLYVYLKNVLDAADTSIFEAYDDLVDLPDLRDMDDKSQKLIIIDDMIKEHPKLLNNVEKISIACRKKNMTFCFISQTFYDVPVCLRRQANYILLQKINSNRTLKQILKDYPMENVTVEDLIKEYKKADGLNFLTIDLKTMDDSQRFRLNFEPNE